MSPEREHEGLPGWARKERASDLAWIEQNLPGLWQAARAGYAAAGRGALIIDTTVVIAEGGRAGNPIFYVSQAGVEEIGDKDALRMVRQYDPSWELVVVLLKSGDRESVYRIGAPPEEPRKSPSRWRSTSIPNQKAAAPGGTVRAADSRAASSCC